MNEQAEINFLPEGEIDDRLFPIADFIVHNVTADDEEAETPVEEIEEDLTDDDPETTGFLRKIKTAETWREKADVVVDFIGVGRDKIADMFEVLLNRSSNGETEPAGYNSEVMTLTKETLIRQSRTGGHPPLAADEEISITKQNPRNFRKSMEPHIRRLKQRKIFREAIGEAILDGGYQMRLFDDNFQTDSEEMEMERLESAHDVELSSEHLADAVKGSWSALDGRVLRYRRLSLFASDEAEELGRIQMALNEGEETTEDDIYFVFAQVHRYLHAFAERNNARQSRIDEGHWSLPLLEEAFHSDLLNGGDAAWAEWAGIAKDYRENCMKFFHHEAEKFDKHRTNPRALGNKVAA